ncbi:MAG: LysR family transcriptional regulator [Acidimicrobiales bacterium]|jgi:DNA-binding transcriptional LysR family regulator
MDLVLIRSLIAVADAGSISDAAEQVHVSQSALSRRLQQLETDLGAQLLVRGRHGVELTDLGRQALEAGRSIVARYDSVRRSIVEQQNLERGIVRIGGGATVTSFMLPAAIASFQSRYPGIRFYVKEAGSSEIAASVVAGELELGILTLPLAARDLETEVLVSDEIVLVARSDHPLADGRELEAADLDGLPFVAFEPGTAIRQHVDTALRDAAVHIDVVMELRSIPTILRMVSVTGNLAFVSRVSVATEPGLRVLEVEGLSIARTLALATRREMPLSAPTEAFRAELLTARR